MASGGRWSWRWTARSAVAVALAAAALVATPGRPAGAAPAVTFRLDPKASRFEVRTKTGGMLGGLAHEHLIRATDPSGRIVFDRDSLEASSVEIAVDARTLVVVDEGVSEKDKKEIAETLRGDEVLDASRHATIRFKSTKVEGSALSPRIRGDFTLHGVTRSIEVWALLSTDPATGRIHAKGSFKVKTSDYGMTPYSAGLGTIKVADEVQIDFEAVGAP